MARIKTTKAFNTIYFDDDGMVHMHVSHFRLQTSLVWCASRIFSRLNICHHCRKWSILSRVLSYIFSETQLEFEVELKFDSTQISTRPAIELSQRAGSLQLFSGNSRGGIFTFCQFSIQRAPYPNQMKIMFIFGLFCRKINWRADSNI